MTRIAKNISLDEELWVATAAAARADGRSMASFIGMTLKRACEAMGVCESPAMNAVTTMPAVVSVPHTPVEVSNTAPKRSRGRPRLDAPMPTPGAPIPKHLLDWQARIEQRRILTRLDQELNKYTEWWIIAGRAVVDRTISDFGDYIQAGAVLEQPIDHEYTDDEAQEWLVARQKEGRDFAWVYVTGDCESRIENYRIEANARLRAMKGMDVAVIEAISADEQVLEAERALYGRPLGIVTLAASRLQLLRETAALMGGGGAMPANLLSIVSKARSVGWRPAGLLPAYLSPR